MTRLNIFSLLILVASMSLSFAVQAAGDKDSAKQEQKPARSIGELTATCAACHGANGVSENAQYPTLAGQYADYLEVSMQAYKNGDRKNPIMAGQVNGLSDAEIKALARYFSKQDGPLYTPSLD